MSIQTSTSRRGERAERYERLLEARILLGRLTVDAICHGDGAGSADLFARVTDLDGRLSRFRRYSADYDQVAAAEDLRWHVPPGTPGDDATRPCSRCLRGQLDLRCDLVLLPATRRSA